MAQLKALEDHWKAQDEYTDFRFGQIAAATYNHQRDIKKHGAVKWWQLLPRWSEKYEIAEKRGKMESLKAWLITEAHKSDGAVKFANSEDKECPPTEVP